MMKAMWEVLQMYAGGGVLGRVAKSFYEKSKARARVCQEKGRSFDMGMGLYRGVGLNDVTVAVQFAYGWGHNSG